MVKELNQQNNQQSDNQQPFDFKILLGWGARAILKLGSFYFLIGLILLFSPQIFGLQEDNKLGSLLSNAGLSFLTAGIVTITIDWESRKRSSEETKNIVNNLQNLAQQRIQEIAEISEEKMLEMLVQEPSIFQQIKNNLIRQDFIIRNHQLTIDFTWAGNEQRFLYQTATIFYEIDNVTNENKDFNLRLGLEIDNLGVNYEVYKILNYQVFNTISKKLEDRLHNKFKNQFQEQIKNQEPLLLLNDKIHTYPGKSTHIKIILKTTLRPTYAQPWVCTKMTDGMKVKITHPENLSVKAEILHPVQFSTDKSTNEILTTPEDQPLRNNKVWTIKTGFLPYQGILLYWKKL